MEREKMVTVSIDVALPNEGTKIVTPRGVISVSTTYPVTTWVASSRHAIKAEVASNWKFRENTILHGERCGKYADSERSNRWHGLDRRELGGAVFGKRF
jgi:hypothetical protein